MKPSESPLWKAAYLTRRSKTKWGMKRWLEEGKREAPALLSGAGRGEGTGCPSETDRDKQRRTKKIKLPKIFRNYQFLYPKKAIVLRINTDKRAACHCWFGKQLSVISP
ncbi:MAG: hypothetical protein ACLUOI_15395 [Eisenbergiella sp.]